VALRSRLRQDLTAAIKARDSAAVAALRSTIAAIENAESVDRAEAMPPHASSQHIAGATAGVGSADVERRVLTEDDELAIVRQQVIERDRAAAEYVQLGQGDEAHRLRQEAELLRRYLLASR
jgi:uncharacterized protein